jgi:hypothetical protein
MSLVKIVPVSEKKFALTVPGLFYLFQSHRQIILISKAAIPAKGK